MISRVPGYKTRQFPVLFCPSFLLDFRVMFSLFGNAHTPDKKTLAPLLSAVDAEAVDTARQLVPTADPADLGAAL